MYVDTQTEFSDAQAVTATAISSNVLDLYTTTTGAATLDSKLQPNSLVDVGQGEDVYLVVQAAAGFGGTGNITVTLESDTAVGLASAPVVHFSSGAIAATAITAGYIVAQIKLPNADYKRYLGVRYTCSGSPTGGTFDAFLTTNVQRSKVYKSGFTVQ